MLKPDTKSRTKATTTRSSQNSGLQTTVVFTTKLATGPIKDDLVPPKPRPHLELKTSLLWRLNPELRPFLKIATKDVEPKFKVIETSASYTEIVTISFSPAFNK